jgi:hypothetical protein
MEQISMQAAPKKSRRGKFQAGVAIKAKQLDALDRLRDQLRLLVRVQGSWVQKARDSDDPRLMQEHRLKVYDRSMQTLVSSFSELETTLLERHPGGAPRNEYRDLAFNVLTDQYIERGEILKAKFLIKALEARLPEGALKVGESGNEPFSGRMAQAVIRDFKACLHSIPSDWE